MSPRPRHAATTRCQAAAEGTPTRLVDGAATHHRGLLGSPSPYTWRVRGSSRAALAALSRSVPSLHKWQSRQHAERMAKKERVSSARLHACPPACSRPEASHACAALPQSTFGYNATAGSGTDYFRNPRGMEGLPDGTFYVAGEPSRGGCAVQAPCRPGGGRDIPQQQQGCSLQNGKLQSGNCDPYRSQALPRMHPHSNRCTPLCCSPSARAPAAPRANPLPRTAPATQCFETASRLPSPPPALTPCPHSNPQQTPTTTASSTWPPTAQCSSSGGRWALVRYFRGRRALLSKHQASPCPCLLAWLHSFLYGLHQRSSPAAGADMCVRGLRSVNS